MIPDANNFVQQCNLIEDRYKTSQMGMSKSELYKQLQNKNRTKIRELSGEFNIGANIDDKLSALTPNNYSQKKSDPYLFNHAK